MSQESDDFIFEDESPADDENAYRPLFWKILVVDDDEDVHLATVHALQDLDILGRLPSFLHAYSAAECISLLSVHSDVAVVLLDVVMESQDAGLKLVSDIRNQLKQAMPRIILRTGQPGYAPELDAIRQYDINDYKTKSELTRSKLFTTVLSAIRAYQQLESMATYQQGLQHIVQSCDALVKANDFQSFSQQAIQQLTDLLGGKADYLACFQASPSGKENLMIAASDNFPQDQAHHLIPVTVAHWLGKREPVFDNGHTMAFLPLLANPALILYLKTVSALSDEECALLKVFCSHAAVCADNVKLMLGLKDSAYYDHQVALPNRQAFVQAIDDRLKQGNSKQYSVIILDIDHFAEINNAFGHHFGDQLLSAFAKRLHDLFGQHCLIARIACDIFALLGDTDLLKPANLRPLMQQTINIDGIVHNVAFSSGTVSLENIQIDGHTVLKDASIARKLARQQGINSDAYYQPEMGLRAKQRTQLLQSLQEGFQKGQLFPAFQPQFDMRDQSLLGFEVLMRWRTASGELVPPDQFIPIAEQSGLIVEMGAWILKAALNFLRTLEDKGWKGLMMSVNVSNVQFQEADFLSVLQQTLDGSGINPLQLELEITESTMADQHNLLDMLRKIRQMGISIAVDDFGTGFSSLSYLQSLPLNRIKIDRSFVNNLCDGKEGRHIASLIIELSRRLNLAVIAEGVENEAQALWLQELGCHLAQGYYYGKPMTENDLLTWLQSQIASPAPMVSLTPQAGKP
ncbi:EAL domain-containing protein [Methylosoma difficile]